MVRLVLVTGGESDFRQPGFRIAAINAATITAPALIFAARIVESLFAMAYGEFNILGAHEGHDQIPTTPPRRLKPGSLLGGFTRR